jgi:hypothetical protein
VIISVCVGGVRETIEDVVIVGSNKFSVVITVRYTIVFSPFYISTLIWLHYSVQSLDLQCILQDNLQHKQYLGVLQLLSIGEIQFKMCSCCYDFLLFFLCSVVT